MKIFEYTVIFEPTEEGGYTVYVPALPGLTTEGRTLDEAKKMAEEAIECHIEALIVSGLSVPKEEKDFTPISEKISVPVNVA